MAKRKANSAAPPTTTASGPLVADPPRPHGLLLAISAILWSVWLLFLIVLALNR